MAKGREATGTVPYPPVVVAMDGHPMIQSLGVHKQRLLDVLFAVGAVLFQILASTLVATVADSLAGRWVIAALGFVVALGWLSRSPPESRARLALALAVASAVIDLALGAFVAYSVPWTSLGWQCPRAAAIALAWWAVSHRALPSLVATAVVAGISLLGGVFALEIANCLGQSRGDPSRATPTAIVLGFGLPESGVPSPVFVARIARGVELYRAGLARRVLFTGGVGTYGPAESVAALAVARAMGLPEGKTLYEDRSHTTRENMSEAARVLRERGLPLGPVAVVSDTFHLARARRLARDAGLDPVMVASVSLAWTSPRRATWWVLREAALLTADDIVRILPRRP